MKNSRRMFLAQFKKMLRETLAGQYESLRNYIQDNKLTTLDLTSAFALLYERGTPRTPESYRQIATALREALQGTTITGLQLGTNGFNDERMLAFAEILPQMPLVSLDISYAELSPEGLEGLLQRLPNTLKTLEVSGVRLNVQSAAILGRGLQEADYSMLNISDVSLGDDGLEAFTREFRGKAKTLNLSTNGITPAGIVALGNLLRKAKTEILYFSFNRVGDQGMRALGEALRNTEVKEIYLVGNGFSGRSAKILEEVFQDHKLRKIDLSDNHLSRIGARELGSACRVQGIREIVLRRTHFHKVGIKSFVKSLPQTHITKANMTSNPVNLAEVDVSFAKVIPRTELINLDFDRMTPELEAALALNQRKLIFTPYTAYCLKHLPKEEKSKLGNCEFPTSLKDKKTTSRYAAGILSDERLPLDVLLHTLSFLPLVNSREGKNQAGKYGVIRRGNHQNPILSIDPEEKAKGIKPAKPRLGQ